MTLSVACGSGDDDGESADASIMLVDSAPMIDSEAVPSCLFDTPVAAPANWIGIADKSDINQTPTNEGDDVDTAVVFAALGTPVQGMPLDLIQLQFFDTIPPFEGGIAPMQVDLSTQADITSSLCGACLFIFADTAQDGSSQQWLMADSGTVDIASATPTVGATVQATLKNVSVRELNGMTGAPVSGGCTATLPEISINVMLMAPSSAPGPQSGPSAVPWDTLPVANAEQR